MNHKIIKYDGSIDGLFSAVFSIYANKYQSIDIRASEATDLFARTITITTNLSHSERVGKKLRQKLGHDGFSQLLKAFLHSDREKDNVIFGVIQHVLASSSPDPLGDFSEPDVLSLSQYVKQIHREIHRMHAFVRFELAADEVYCAGIVPDYDVLPLIIPFFKRRYRSQQFLIADLSRGYGVYYDLKTISAISISTSDWEKRKENYSDKEVIYQKLWRNYFKSTCISERKSMRRHKQHVPERYWQYLTEKSLLI